MSSETSVETSAPAAALAPTVESINVGPYILYPESDFVHFVDDNRRVYLTRFEMILLAYLATYVGRFVSKDELSRHLYSGQPQRPGSNGIEVLIGRIRRKIDPTDQYKPLLTARYLGYCFRNDWKGSTAP